MSWTDTELRFKQAFDQVERLVEDRYDLRVVIGDVVDPNTGDFDGVSITLDHDNDLRHARDDPVAAGEMPGLGLQTHRLL